MKILVHIKRKATDRAESLWAGGALGRREATGHGVAFLALRALDDLKTDPHQATAIVEGFGNVGSHAALRLASKGVKIVRLGDHSVACYDSKGAIEHVSAHHVLKGFVDQAEIHPSELLTQPCDTLPPCAIERVCPTKAELFYSPIFLFLLAPRKLHGRFPAKRRPV